MGTILLILFLILIVLGVMRMIDSLTNSRPMNIGKSPFMSIIDYAIGVVVINMLIAWTTGGVGKLFERLDEDQLFTIYLLCAIFFVILWTISYFRKK
jgi:uncharacterized membrane protein HdeD (DUF308 family)